MTKVLLALIATIITSNAFAMLSFVPDRRISMQQAQTWAANARLRSNFAFAANDVVLAELNHYLGSPGGRNEMRNSLRLLEYYRPMLVLKFLPYHLPQELMAIPIIESGYQNISGQGLANRGAGIWMFIVSTAQAYGLSTNGIDDQRFNPQAETDAAARLLTHSQKHFGDWLLTIFAYNSGESRTRKAILLAHTRDAWVLTRAGYGNDKTYLAKVMAAILVMYNPDAAKD